MDPYIIEKGDGIVDRVDERKTVELLKQLMRIRSMSGCEQELADFVGRRLEAMGMGVSRDVHGNLYAEYRFGQLTGGGSAAEGKDESHGPADPEELDGPDGLDGPVILFNTHLDNVPVGEGWEIDPFSAEELDGVIYGRGACDPKGAMAAMIAAVEAVIEDERQGRGPDGEAAQAQRSGRQGTVVFMGAVAEEISPPSAKGTWKAVKDGLVKADMAVCGEPTNNVPCIGEFGKMEYEIVAHGKPSHASAPEKGVNAILHMARLLTALDERVERRWSELLDRRGTLNPGLISGGVQINIVPETARARVERRLVPGQTAEESLTELCRICDEVKAEVPELNYEIRVVGEGNAAVISRDEPVARMMRESVMAVTGRMPEDRGFVAHADADWLITYGNIPTVIFGPGALSDAHTCHEQVTVRETAEAARVLAVFLDRALRQ